VVAWGAGAAGDVTEVLGLAPVSEEGLMVPAVDPDGVSAADVPIVTLADTLAADREAVTDTAVLLLLHPAEVTAALQLEPAEVTGAASEAADFRSADACWTCAEDASEEPLASVLLTGANSVADAGASVDDAVAAVAGVGVVMLVLATTALYCCISITAASSRT